MSTQEAARIVVEALKAKAEAPGTGTKKDQKRIVELWRAVETIERELEVSA
jgi:hypothetical protein